MTRAMKDSGVPWIGEIPAGWKVGGLGQRYEVQLGKMLDQKASRGTQPAPYLRNQDVQWGTVRTADLPMMDFDEDERRKFALRPGDLLICEGGDVGRTAIWRGELSECFFQKAVHRVRPRRSDQSPRYLFWVMRTVTASGHFEASGNRSTILHLTAEQLRALRIPFPPLAEQQRIAAFLDERTAAIDVAIAEHERNVGLLSERRRTLISDAVTRGLDADVATKDSGVSWIGEIPAGWSVVRLGRITESYCDGPFGSGLKSEHYVESGVRVIRLKNIGSGRFLESDAAYVSVEHFQSLGRHEVIAGDLVLAGLGDDNHPVGRACVVPDNLGLAMVKADCFRFRLNPLRACPSFVCWYLASDAAIRESRAEVRGATRSRINLTDAAMIRLPLPPLAEQQRIAAFLDERTSAIDAAAAESQRSTELLREYRQSLVTAAVTGRVSPDGAAS